MTDTDFDFDFDVGRGDPSPGSRTDEGAEAKGNGNGNGAAPANGRRPAEKDPFDALDGPGGGGEDLNGEGDPPMRRFRPRSERQPAPGSGRRSSNGSANGLAGEGNAGGRTGNGGAPNALVHGDARDGPRAPARRDPSTAAPSQDDDWLSLADDPPRGAPQADLNSIATGDPGPAGPPTPGEGRSLARAARRRATGSSTSVDAVLPSERRESRERDSSPEDFEKLLSRQPQKSGVGRRASAVAYGLRGLLDDGR